MNKKYIKPDIKIVYLASTLYSICQSSVEVKIGDPAESGSSGNAKGTRGFRDFSGNED